MADGGQQRFAIADPICQFMEAGTSPQIERNRESLRAVGWIDQPTAISFFVDESFDVGQDAGTHVVDGYA